jgi:predicted secreted protein
MASQAKIGHGALFRIENDNSPASFTTIGEITSITMPSISRDAIDATHSESPNQWREFIAGLKDGGEVSAELNMVPGSAGTTLLMAQLTRSEPTACRIIFPANDYQWSFDAIMTGFESEAPVDDKMTATVTFKITGQPVLAAVA